MEEHIGRENLVSRSGNGFERIGDGECTITLDNSDGRYEQRNVKSPLYPHLQNSNERAARVWVKNGDNGDVYPLITGRMVDLTPKTSKRGISELVLKIKDMTYVLNRSKVYIEEIGEEIRSGAAI